jgi:hypothetical protein
MPRKQIPTWLGLALAWSGYWAPWIAHRAAALNLNGYELAEWITFLPGLRDGSLRLGRLDFLLPLSCICLLTALAAWLTPNLPGWARWAATAVAFLGAFAILPEYPFILTAHADPELRPALTLGVFTMVAVLVAGPAIPRLPQDTRWRALWPAADLTLIVVAIAFGAWALVIVWPALAEVFNAAPRLNWGPVALGIGLVMRGVEPVRALVGRLSK